MLGGRDHTTVLHGCSKVEELMRTNPTVRAAAEDLTRRLKK